MAEEFIDDIIAASPAKDADPVAKESPKLTEVQMGAVGDPDELTPVTDSKDTKAAKPADSSVEELATQLGWRADHVGEDAVDAKTYILRSKDIQQSMSQHNKDLKSQLGALNGSVEALKIHNEKVYKAEVKKLEGEVAALKKERKEAIELADVEKVEELDQQIEDRQKDINTPKAADKQSDTANPAYDSWIKDNDWYLNDSDMAQFADNVAQQYQGAPLERIYSLVRQKVQEVFPEKFATSKPVDKIAADKPALVGPKSPVESSSSKGSEGSFTKADLSDDQRQIMNQFVRGGIMTEAQYVNDIAKMQG